MAPHTKFLTVPDSDSVAVEVAIGTSPAYELGNIWKCLNSPASVVWVLSPTAKHLALIEDRLKDSGLDHQRVRFLLPEELKPLLVPSEEKRVRGYRIKVRHSASSGDGRSERVKEVERVLAGSLRRVSQEPQY
jgi:hypothetical protein